MLSIFLVILLRLVIVKTRDLVEFDVIRVRYILFFINVLLIVHLHLLLNFILFLRIDILAVRSKLIEIRRVVCILLI